MYKIHEMRKKGDTNRKTDKCHFSTSQRGKKTDRQRGIKMNNEIQHNERKTNIQKYIKSS